MFEKRLTPILKIITRNLQNNCNNNNIGIIGVPFGKGQRKYGVEDGPKVLREHGLIIKLKELHPSINVRDYGDVLYDVPNTRENLKNMLSYPDVISCNRELSKTVKNVLNDGRVCITIGGDHSIAIGSVDGHIQAKFDNVAVLWIDAHADINTSLLSESGNMHGMPLGLLTKELVKDWNKLPGTEWMKRSLSLKNLAYIGLRSVDEAEKILINEYDITAYGMQDVDKYGVKSLVQMALNKIDPERNRSIHVSFDIDSLDVLEAPSTGTPVRGGLTLREGIQIMELLYETGRVSVIDLVEVNPSIGDEEDVKRTVTAAIEIILAAFNNRNTFTRISE